MKDVMIVTGAGQISMAIHFRDCYNLHSQILHVLVQPSGRHSSWRNYPKN